MSIEGLYNFRDVGGLPLTGGGTTNNGVLFRSDALSGLTPAGIDALAATPIGIVVDLRTPTERTAAPDRLPTSRPMRVEQFSILEGAMANAATGLLGGAEAPSAELVAQALSSLPSLDEMYTSMLQSGAVAFSEVARLIAARDDETPSAVLVHCTAGKDRTGVATALMLDAVGVERDAIISDYAVSQDNLAGTWAAGMLRMLAASGLPSTPALVTLATATPPAAIERALAWITDDFGDSAGYLLSRGLSEAELDSLRSRLTR